MGVDSSRHVEFEACFNFRDIGGYPTTEGGRVRWGTVFRSGSLHRLTAADRGTIARLGVRTVIDLRTEPELERDGAFRDPNDVAFHHVPFNEGGEEPGADYSGLEAPPLGRVYLAMATAGRSAVADALRVIAEGDHPVVVHCFAGKDRTGIVVALLLATLGVSDDVITADYQLTDLALAPSIAWAEVNDPEWAERIATLPAWVLAASGESMRAFLDALRSRHGSIDDYLIDTGLDARDLDRLRSRLLQA